MAFAVDLNSPCDDGPRGHWLMNLSNRFLRRVAGAFVASVFLCLPAFASDGEYSELLKKAEDARRNSDDAKTNAPWWRCKNEIKAKHTPPRYVGIHGKEPGPQVHVSYAGKEAFQFGTTYYLVATMTDGSRKRFACSMTKDGEIWELGELR